MPPLHVPPATTTTNNNSNNNNSNNNNSSNNNNQQNQDIHSINNYSNNNSSSSSINTSSLSSSASNSRANSPIRGVSCTPSDTPLDPRLEILRQRLRKVMKRKTESVEDGGGGDGGDGGGGEGGGGGSSRSGEVGGASSSGSITTNTQVMVDSRASSTTVVSDNSTETSTKTTTSKFTKTTKVKTIKIVKKRNSLVANAVNEINSLSDSTKKIEDSPRRFVIKKPTIDTPIKVPSPPKKIPKPMRAPVPSEAGRDSKSPPVAKTSHINGTKDSLEEKGTHNFNKSVKVDATEDSVVKTNAAVGEVKVPTQQTDSSEVESSSKVKSAREKSPATVSMEAENSSKVKSAKEKSPVKCTVSAETEHFSKVKSTREKSPAKRAVSSQIENSVKRKSLKEKSPARSTVSVEDKVAPKTVKTEVPTSPKVSEISKDKKSLSPKPVEKDSNEAKDAKDAESVLCKDSSPVKSDSSKDVSSGASATDISLAELSKDTTPEKSSKAVSPAESSKDGTPEKCIDSVCQDLDKDAHLPKSSTDISPASSNKDLSPAKTPNFPANESPTKISSDASPAKSDSLEESTSTNTNKVAESPKVGKLPVTSTKKKSPKGAVSRKKSDPDNDASSSSKTTRGEKHIDSSSNSETASAVKTEIGDVIKASEPVNSSEELTDKDASDNAVSSKDSSDTKDVSDTSDNLVNDSRSTDTINTISTVCDAPKTSDSDSNLDSELSNVSVFVIVRDMSGLTATVNKVTIVTPATSTCGELMQEVGRRFKYEPDSFSLILQCSDGTQVEVEKMEAERTLADARFQVEGTPRNNLILCDMGGHPPRRTDEDDLSLGASASPTANATERKWFERSSNYDTTTDYSYASAVIKHDTGYVGLVNQAMTCYLNSLLQTLFMTPEFRNALYQWEFKGTEEEAAKNIPCQLQRLFLLLQTANKTAVETTNLTKSFGWDSSEAWQQHDIQELCRVMFDALEQCFKNTHQSDLINNLYQGKMKDYVKCLECDNEGAREDTYLDIPLPIRPFGSSTAYKSVEEALKAFVEPELLTGNNKYKCSKCDSLCDAHKGLKFMRFPYLLTIHLMRFDFDYQTLHRIKLNDEVTFPNFLDLNCFIERQDKEDCGILNSAVTPDKTSTDKIDDASTTDSGSALDVEENSNSMENTSNSQPESDNQDEDEGIDVSSMYNEKNKGYLSNGPYVYELFSIMVHSGSASGGHYYAYIMDFKTGGWFCFNDQSVSKITYDDIRKTYGGSNLRGGYYSGWSSSANAYMLMYRQIDKERNVDAYAKEDLPQHIKDLVQRMTAVEAAERELREIERCMCRIKLFCQLPGQSQMVEKKLRIHKDSTLRETTKQAYQELGLENTVPLERCRLVKYEEFHDSLECSFEGQEDELISEVLGGVRSSYKFDLLMEIRDEDKTFEVYKPGGTTIKAFVVNLQSEEVEGPSNVRGCLNMTVRELKELLGRSLNLNPDTMRVVLERYYNDLRPLTADTKTLKMEGFYRSNKVYVESSDAESNDWFVGSSMYHILDRYENTITLFCPLPDTSKEALEEMQIPPYKEEEAECAGMDIAGTSSNNGSTGTATAVSSASPADTAASPASCSSKDSGISSKAPTESSISEIGSCSTSGIVSPSSGPCVPSVSASTSAVTASPGTSSSTQTTMGLAAGGSATTPTASPTTTSTGNGSDGEDEGIADADSGASSSNVNSDQSASEDSSLTSDSDRTLVGDPPEDKLSDASNSPDYRNVSSPEDNGRDTKGDDKGWGLPIFQDNDVVWGDDEKEVEIKRYFRAEYFTDEETNQKTLRVHVDKRITVGQLKNEMQRWVGVSHEHFKLFKIYSNSKEFECTRMTETLASYGDNTKLSVRLGRALLPGEQRGKVYLLDPESIDDPARFLIDWVLCKGDTVANAKRAIIKEVNSRCNMNLVAETVRLRKKSWKNPQTIYLDAQKFENDISLYSNWELFLQVLDGPETRTNNTDELALFAKRWRPSKYTTDPLIEIIISKPSIDDLKQKLSEVSGIEADDIEFAKGKGTFPCDMSVLDLTNDLDWTPRSGQLDQRPLYILDDGAMIYFRDKNEVQKELSDEERRELINSENRRLNRDLQYSCPSSSTTNYSTLRSREKGLKIYLNHEE